jgi:hypothetical protein
MPHPARTCVSKGPMPILRMAWMDQVTAAREGTCATSFENRVCERLDSRHRTPAALAAMSDERAFRCQTTSFWSREWITLVGCILRRLSYASGRSAKSEKVRFCRARPATMVDWTPSLDYLNPAEASPPVSQGDRETTPRDLDHQTYRSLASRSACVSWVRCKANRL